MTVVFTLYKMSGVLIGLVSGLIKGFNIKAHKGALNSDIHAENCEYILSFNAR